MGFKGLSWHGILDGPCMLILDCHGSKLPLPKLKSKLCGNNFHFGYLGVGARGLNVLAKCEVQNCLRTICCEAIIIFSYFHLLYR